MTSFDQGIGRLRNAAGHLAGAAGALQRGITVIAGPIAEPWGRFTRRLKALTPTGLYARSLLIIILPMVIVQSVVAFMFLGRHWDLVTKYLASAVTQEIATLIDVYRTYPQGADRALGDEGVRRVLA